MKSKEAEQELRKELTRLKKEISSQQGIYPISSLSKSNLAR